MAFMLGCGISRRYPFRDMVWRWLERGVLEFGSSGPVSREDDLELYQLDCHLANHSLKTRDEFSME
jgi:hypothetical protein